MDDHEQKKSSLATNPAIDQKLKVKRKRRKKNRKKRCGRLERLKGSLQQKDKTISKLGAAELKLKK